MWREEYQGSEGTSFEEGVGMKCPACESERVTRNEVSTGRWDCRECKAAWFYSGTIWKDRATLTYYIRSGEETWRFIPVGCLLVLREEGI